MRGRTRSWSFSRGAIHRSRRDLAIRGLRRQASTANSLFRESVNDIPRPGSAPKDKRTLTVGGGKKTVLLNQDTPVYSRVQYSPEEYSLPDRKTISVHTGKQVVFLACRVPKCCSLHPRPEGTASRANTMYRVSGLGAIVSGLGIVVSVWGLQHFGARHARPGWDVAKNAASFPVSTKRSSSSGL